MTVHRPPADRRFAPQGNQCLLSYFLASLGAQEKTNCTSMLWAIDSCQERASAEQYHLTVPRAQVSTHRVRVLFWSYPLTDYQFQIIAGLSLFFPNIHIKHVVFMRICVGHAQRPIFMLWLVKIWQVSSCGKFMQHLESCLLWQLKLTEFCVNLWCF